MLIADGEYNERVQIDGKRGVELLGGDDVEVRSLDLFRSDGVTLREMTVTEASGTQIAVTLSDDVTIRSCSIGNGLGVGLSVADSDRLTVFESNVTNLSIGVQLNECDEASIARLLFANLGVALSAGSSDDILVEDCSLKEAGSMRIGDCRRATVRANKLRGTSISMDDCDGSLIEGNRIDKSRDTGLLLQDGGLNQLMQNKVQRSNGIGIHVDSTDNFLLRNTAKRNLVIDHQDDNLGTNTYVANLFGTSNL